MAEKVFFEVECCNPECPQKVFNMSHGVVDADAQGMERVEVTCLYCETVNMVQLPAAVVGGDVLVRGGLLVKGMPASGQESG